MSDYRRAIVINNIGVALLSRQAYPQAMSTLKDAIFVMRNGLCQSPSENGDASSLNCCGAEERVNKAAKLLASHQRQCSVSPVCTIRFEGGCVDLPSALPLLEDHLSSVILNPVHIEIADFECLNDRDTDLDSAIMLYNFGLAHAAMAGQQDSPATAMKLRMGSLSLLDMAKTIIMDDRCIPHLKSLEDVEEMKQNRLQVSFVIASATLRMLLSLGELNAANEIMEQLMTLEGAIGEMMDSTVESNTVATLHAAAAA